MSDRVAFIGDIHGVVDPLIKVVERVRDDADVLVFLGDYVNRGAQSRQVLEFLVELQQDLGHRTHFLLGHHDDAFRAAVDEGRIDRFLRMGGAATLSSYPRQGPDDAIRVLSRKVPAQHVEFLRHLERSFAADGYFAAHDPSDKALLAEGTYGVFGHRLMTAGLPVVDETRALIDTGCGTLPGGKLTCFLWPSKTWFQES